MNEVQSWGDAIFLSIQNAVYTFLAAIPQIIGALLIIIIGWIISGILARIVRGLLERAGADRAFARHGGDVYGTRSRDFQPSVVASEVVKWIVRFIFIVAAANVLGMPQVSVLLNEILLWIPNLIVAAIILLVAPLLARFVRGAIEVGAGEMGFGNGRLLGRIAEVAIIAFAVVIALYQLGIAADLINILFIGIVAALAIAFGLAFGLGGRDVAARLTEQWYAGASTAAGKVREVVDAQDSASPSTSTTTTGSTTMAPNRQVIPPTPPTAKRPAEEPGL